MNGNVNIHSYLGTGSRGGRGHEPQVENHCCTANTTSNFAAVSHCRDSEAAALPRATRDHHRQQNSKSVPTSGAPLKETTPQAFVPAGWWALAEQKTRYFHTQSVLGLQQQKINHTI